MRDPARVRSEPEVPSPDATGRILRLQQALGNASVTRLIQRRDGPQTTDAPRKRPAKPPKKEAAAADIHSRVIGVAVEGGKTRITIGVGEGVERGMMGSLLDAEGEAYESFEIAGVKGGTSWAFVRATTDQVTKNPKVVITPSKRKPRGPEDEHI